MARRRLRASNTASLGLLSLPAPLLGRISGILGVADRAHLSCTCKQLHSVSLEATDWTVFSVPEFVLGPEHTGWQRLLSLLHWVGRRREAVTGFNLTFNLENVEGEEEAQAFGTLAAVLSTCTQLREVYLSWRNAELPLHLGAWLAVPPALQELDLNAGVPLVVEAGLAAATQLRELCLTPEVLPAATLELQQGARLPPNLTSLRLEGYALPELGWQHCPPLQSLGMYYQEVEALAMVATLAHCLRQLTWHQETPGPRPPMVPALPCLESLYLHCNDRGPAVGAGVAGGAGQQQEADWAHVLAPLKQLRLLSIEYYQLRTLPVAITKLPELQVLYCHGNKIGVLPGGTWLGRLLELSCDWPTLLSSAAALAGATALRRLYVGGSGEGPFEKGVTAAAVLQVLRRLPSLRQVVSFAANGVAKLATEPQRVLASLERRCPTVELLVRGDDFFGLRLEDLEEIGKK